MLIPSKKLPGSVDRPHQLKVDDFPLAYSAESAPVSQRNTTSNMAAQTLDIQPGDIVIAVMGITGVGKSTFISHFVGNVPIGHTLESCTSGVEMYECKYTGKNKVFFVDTPGFDDTHRTELAILREIADWLSRAYAKAIELTGIIYLHRIMDVRLGGSAVRNLRMFRKLCGDDALASVVLATTWWTGVDEETGAQRERQLQTRREFWADMISKGSKVFRQDSGDTSARRIVDYLIARKRPVVLDIQDEMVNQQKTLDQTAAGTEVDHLLAQQRQEFEKQLKDIQNELREALRNKDLEFQEELEEHKKETEERMRKAEESRLMLQSNCEELRQQRDQEMEEERRRFEEQLSRNNEKIVESETRLRIMELEFKSDMEKQELKFLLEKERIERAHLNRELEKRAKCIVM